MEDTELRSPAWHIFTAIRAMAAKGMSAKEIVGVVVMDGMSTKDVEKITAMSDEDLDEMDRLIWAGELKSPVQVQMTEEILLAAELKKRGASKEEILDELAKWRKEHPFRPPTLIDHH